MQHRTQLERAPVLDDNGLEVLSRADCLQLLSGATFGRIAVTFSAMPVVLPVNFRLVDDVIVFRTGPGTKLEAASDHAVVAFQVDQIEPDTHNGWSVLATGLARVVTDPDERLRYASAGIPRWVPGDEEHFVVVATDLLSGRRLRNGDAAPAPV